MSDHPFKKYRQFFRKTQAQLGVAIKSSGAVVGHYEQGVINPSEKVIDRVALFFKLDRKRVIEDLERWGKEVNTTR